MRRPPPDDRFDRRLLAPMMFGAALNPLNSAIISVALTPISIAFGAPASDVLWLVSALYLTSAIGQPLFGRLVDVFGPRPLSILGAALAIASGVIGVLAPSLWALVLARVVLGLGTCAGYPAAMHLIRSEGRRTGQASPSSVLAALMVTSQTIIVLGPTLGGVLVEVGTWRATFAVNLPLGVVTLVLCWFLMPRRSGLEPAKADRPRIDWIGIALFSVALVGLLLFLMQLGVELLWGLGVALVVGAAFVLWELRTPQPFLDLRVLAGNGPLILTYLRTLLSATIMYTVIYTYAQWLQDGRGLSPAVTGLVMLATFGVGVLVTVATGRMPQVRWKLLVGTAAYLVAALLTLTLGADSPIWLIVVVMAVLGIPQGLVSLANQNALYAQAEPERIASSAGLFRTFMYLGAISASAAAAAFFGPRATTDGMHGVAWFNLGAGLLLLVMSALDRSLGRVGGSRPIEGELDD